MFCPGCGLGFGFGPVNALMTIIFWAIIIILIILLVRGLAGTRRYYRDRDYVDRDTYQEKTEQEKTPLDIVKERYAKGEITKKEYDEMRNDLVE